MGCLMSKRIENKKRQLQLIEGANCDQHAMINHEEVTNDEIQRIFNVFAKLDTLPQSMMYSYFGYVPFIEHSNLNAIRDYLNMTRPHLRDVFITALTHMDRNKDISLDKLDPYKRKDNRPSGFLKCHVSICGIQFTWMDQDYTHIFKELS